MGIFGKLFGNKKIKITDSDFGEIKSFSIRGNNIGWTFKKQFFDSEIEILIYGDYERISQIQKLILINALKNESEIKSESEKALKEQFENAEIEFISIEKHFNVNNISINDYGFELTFQEKNAPYHYFNIHFENNRQVAVSIDT